MTIKSLDDVRQQVDGKLQELFSDKAHRGARIDELYRELLTDMGEFIRRGGKRFRPYLVYLGYAGYGGRSEAIIDVAVGYELFHNYLLIHDDVMDRDLKRYGGYNLSGLYDKRFLNAMSPQEARHYADSMAILAGDINCALAYEQILEADFPPGVLIKVASRLHRMIFEIAGGQQLDVMVPVLPADQINEDRLLAVSLYKTAGYTFEATLQVGAILAGASSEQLDLISAVAMPLGVAFQMRDDILGVFGNENKLGKSTLSDIREGKRTLLSHYALEMADEDQKALLKHCLGNPDVTYGDLGRVRDIMVDCGAKERIERLTAAKAEEAKGALKRLKMLAPAAAELDKLIELTVSRDI